LRNGPRHVLIAAGMVAMYLSSEGARTSAKRGTTRAFVRAGGLLAMLLLPVLRAWRIAHRLRAGSAEAHLRTATRIEVRARRHPRRQPLVRNTSGELTASAADNSARGLHYSH
jgi:hypothetical protein